MGSLILLLCITVLALISNGCKHTTSNKKMKVNHGDGGAGESGFRGAEGSGAWDGIIGLCTEAGEGATGDEKAMPPDGCPGKAAHKERASKMRIGGRLPTLGCNTQSWVCLQGKRPLCCKPPHNWGIFRLILVLPLCLKSPHCFQQVCAMANLIASPLKWNEPLGGNGI